MRISHASPCFLSAAQACHVSATFRQSHAHSQCVLLDTLAADAPAGYPSAAGLDQSAHPVHEGLAAVTPRQPWVHILTHQTHMQQVVEFDSHMEHQHGLILVHLIVKVVPQCGVQLDKQVSICFVLGPYLCRQTVLPDVIVHDLLHPYATLQHLNNFLVGPVVLVQKFVANSKHRRQYVAKLSSLALQDWKGGVLLPLARTRHEHVDLHGIVPVWCLLILHSSNLQGMLIGVM